MFCVFALLSAGTAQAERVSEPYAKVGYWEITTENHTECVMKSLYPGKVANDEQGLLVLYNAQQKFAAMSWAAHHPEFPPLRDSMVLDLAFLKGSSMNESWGSQAFQIDKHSDGYGFTHVFKGSADSDRFLRDLASHDSIALFLGPLLMTGLPLQASDAVRKLRECSAKAVEQDTSDRLQK